MNRKIYPFLIRLRKKIKKSESGYHYEYLDSPIRADRVLIDTFSGTSFQGNMYFMYKYMFQNGYDYKFVLTTNNVEKLKNDLKGKGLYDEKRVEIIDRNSEDFYKELYTDKYLLNNVSFPLSFVKKNGQVYLNTWHGTPLKTLGKDVVGDNFYFSNAQRNFLMADYLIAPNEFTNNVFTEGHCLAPFMKDNNVLMGYPRNSVFFDEEYKKELKKRLNLGEKKIIVYMPTWRGTGISGAVKTSGVEIADKIAEYYDGKAEVYAKLHPAESSNATFKKAKTVPKDLEIYEFLSVADWLITDYSSVYIDYACNSNKIVLYQYDREQYLNERGMYEEIFNDTPYTIAEELNQVFDAIDKDVSVDDKAFKEKYCKYDGINCVKQCVDMLFSNPKKENKTINAVLLTEPITQSEIEELNKKFNKPLFILYLDKKTSDSYGSLDLNDIYYTTYSGDDFLTMKEARRVLHRRKGYEKYVHRELDRFLCGVEFDNVYLKKGSYIPLLFKDKNEIKYY